MFDILCDTGRKIHLQYLGEEKFEIPADILYRISACRDSRMMQPRESSLMFLIL